jgi:hypothetical protein
MKQKQLLNMKEEKEGKEFTVLIDILALNQK